MKNNETVKQFNDFKWIDLLNPDKKQLNEISLSSNIEVHFIKDILKYDHLPKIEKVNDYTFIILRAYSADENKNVTTIGQLSNKIAFLYNETELLTVHHVDFSFLHSKKYQVQDSESLVLEFIMQMLTTYETPVQIQSDKMDKIEYKMFLKGGNSVSVENLYFHKSKARISKKVLLLTQNVLNQFPVKKENKSKLQDIKDTLLQLILMYDEILEDANSLFNTYLALKAQKTNDVMKLLTVFSAFFLPLTFIAGVYGMNFYNMPELRWNYGYFFIIGIMSVIVIIVYVWFKRKKII
ncbi:MAG: hypothetical protein L3J56_02245 [Bacteroidales bacterium]|nr:hypothetical protein [Bacteroidales bacterium]